MGDEIVIHKHLAQMSRVVLPVCKCHLHRGGSGVGDVFLPALPRMKSPAPESSRGLFAEGQEAGAPRAGAPRVLQARRCDEPPDTCSVWRAGLALCTAPREHSSLLYVQS